MLFDDRVSDEFAAKVKKIGSELGIVPDYLMAVMGFETGLSFSPSVKNPLSTATGLIQFMAATASGLGTSCASLAAMSAVDQLDYVKRYFQGQINTYGPLNTLTDVYLAVFYPAAIGEANSYQFSDSVARVNPAFTGDNGSMTKQDILDTITDWVKKNGGDISVVTQYNYVYISVTVAGVALMCLWFFIEKYRH